MRLVLLRHQIRPAYDRVVGRRRDEGVERRASRSSSLTDEIGAALMGAERYARRRNGASRFVLSTLRHGD